MEVSAKTGSNVDIAFRALCEQVKENVESAQLYSSSNKKSIMKISPEIINDRERNCNCWLYIFMLIITIMLIITTSRPLVPPLVFSWLFTWGCIASRSSHPSQPERRVECILLLLPSSSWISTSTHAPRLECCRRCQQHMICITMMVQVVVDEVYSFSENCLEIRVHFLLL